MVPERQTDEPTDTVVIFEQTSWYQRTAYKIYRLCFTLTVCRNVSGRGWLVTEVSLGLDYLPSQVSKQNQKRCKQSFNKYFTILLKLDKNLHIHL